MPGLPAKYAKMGFKKGWKAYKASKKKKKTSPKKSTKKVNSKVGKRSFLSTSTIFKFLRLGSLIAPGIGEYNRTKKIDEAFMAYSGWVPGYNRFDKATFLRMWTPFIMTNLITFGVQKLNGIIRGLK